VIFLAQRLASSPAAGFSLWSSLLGAARAENLTLFLRPRCKVQFLSTFLGLCRKKSCSSRDLFDACFSARCGVASPRLNRALVQGFVSSLIFSTGLCAPSFVFSVDFLRLCSEVSFLLWLRFFLPPNLLLHSAFDLPSAYSVLAFSFLRAHFVQ
jgi:hypothetical protein